VERAATARALALLGVEYGQGYWLSRPLAASRLHELSAPRLAG
jgi:EAL domain-containing protein (putative c-di-GMP-specific phosphodiesterase class I)